MTVNMTTVSKLTPGARILLSSDRTALAVTEYSSCVATVRRVEPIGRRRNVVTDLGIVAAGPTARVLLAPDVDAETATAEPSSDGDDLAADSGDGDDVGARHIVAVATVDQAGRLTAESTVTVDGVTQPVPLFVDHPGGAVAPARLDAVLREMGYRPRGRWAHAGRGHVACVVEPIPDGETECPS